MQRGEEFKKIPREFFRFRAKERKKNGGVFSAPVSSHHVERRDDASTNLIFFIGFTFLSNWPRHGDEIYRYTFATLAFLFASPYIKSSPLTFLPRKSRETDLDVSCNLRYLHSFDAAIRTAFDIYLRSILLKYPFVQNKFLTSLRVGYE